MTIVHDTLMPANPNRLNTPPDDPVFLHTRREMFIIFGVWAVCLLWVVPYCYVFGYRPVATPDELTLVLGMPAWVVWGIALPWLLADIATIIICVWVMEDDDLEAGGPITDS